MDSVFALMQNICVEKVQAITCKKEDLYKEEIILSL